jgi:myosin regulatory light chain 12
MASRKTTSRRTTTKKRAQRATSNVFAMFDQAQIQEFKEAFNMIDQNRDGFVDKEDLHDMLASLGKQFCVWQQPLQRCPHLCAHVCCKGNETF